MAKQFRLDLDDELHKRLKRLMVETDVSMAEHVRKAIEAYLATQEPIKEKGVYCEKG